MTLPYYASCPVCGPIDVVNLYERDDRLKAHMRDEHPHLCACNGAKRDELRYVPCGKPAKGVGYDGEPACGVHRRKR